MEQISIERENICGAKALVGNLNNLLIYVW